MNKPTKEELADVVLDSISTNVHHEHEAKSFNVEGNNVGSVDHLNDDERREYFTHLNKARMAKLREKMATLSLKYYDPPEDINEILTNFGRRNLYDADGKLTVVEISFQAVDNMIRTLFPQYWNWKFLDNYEVYSNDVYVSLYTHEEEITDEYWLEILEDVAEDETGKGLAPFHALSYLTEKGYIPDVELNVEVSW